MKKITILVQKKDAEFTLTELRGLGVLHVEHIEIPASRDIALLKQDIEVIDEAIAVLSKEEFQGETCEKPAKTLSEWKFIAKHIVDSYKRLDQLEEYSRSVKNRIKELQGWGDFDLSLVEEFTKKNIFIKLYQVPAKEISKLPQNLVVKKIFCAGGFVNCALVSRKKIELPFKEIALPKTRLKHLESRALEDEKAVHLIKEEIKRYGSFKDDLIEIKSAIEDDLGFEEALSGMGKQGDISYITGYVPFNETDRLLRKAKLQKWAVLIKDPSPDDNVPTLIRNPRWVSIIRPVFKFIGILPGYSELDISLIFLIFFSIFFGIIIGDAGYGLIYALITFLIQKKRGFNKKEQPTFFLFYLLSSCAIIWGVLTGTIFGQTWIANSIKPLVPALNRVTAFQTFCFFLGALHLSLAHSWRAILKFPSLTGLVDIGWICVLWTVFFLAKALILGDSYPIFANWLLASGLILVIFFTHPQKNILKAFGAGLGNLALSLMNNFTDVVSYVRLFAVSLAGLSVADTFNNMASGLGRGNIFTIILALLILFVGHSLNLVLGPMSILVHGIRLNVLEFCAHVDVKWSGFNYKPLK